MIAASRLQRCSLASRGSARAVRVVCASGQSAPASEAAQATKPPAAAAPKPAAAKPQAQPPVADPKAPSSTAKAAAQVLAKPPSKPVVARPVRAPDSWPKLVEAEKSGTTIEVVVKAVNKGGLVANYAELKGFIPFHQLTSSAQGSDFKHLVGQKLKVKVVSTDSSNGRKEFVLSEKKAQMSEAMRYIKLGGTVKAVVSSVEDYGAFVELVDVPGVSGLVHKSELSWDSVLSVDAVVQKGQVVMVKVIDLDPVKGRLGLSLKQMQPDPIKVTMDTVQWGPTRSVPYEMEQLMNRLRQQEGVEDVQVGRQATEAKIASQELGVYLTKEPAQDGYNVVARLGNLLQELLVITKMSREEARELLARVAAQG